MFKNSLLVNKNLDIINVCCKVICSEYFNNMQSSKQHTCRLDAIIPVRNTQLKYGIWNILQNSKFTSITLKWNILPKTSFSFRQDFAFTSISNKSYIYKWNRLQKSRLCFPRGSHAGPSPFLTMATTPIF